MQAIRTKYIPATNSKGSRIKATCSAGSLTISYPTELSGQACYRAAAEALADKLDWDVLRYGRLLGGGLPDGSYCFVFDNDASLV
jgi:hypothetical protein